MCFRICHVNRSSYNGYAQARDDEDSAANRKRAEDEQYKEKMRQIMKKLSYVPGERTFRTFLWRLFDLNLGRKRISRLMKEMGLHANTPRKDAYKGQAKHDHLCTAPDNLVSQNFRIAPRRILCTDITYLYYGPMRSLLYLCVFKDAYTKEILGWSLQPNMTTGLIREAYDRMMKKHGTELKSAPQVIIQSDQGSQFLSTDFSQLLEDESFLQSVSARANSQDNAPVESFFGRMKTVLLDMMKLCRTAADAQRMTDGYINAYNDEHYQYNLAGLTPHEFYLYTMTGIYPCDSYYGVRATALHSLDSIVRSDIRREEERERKARDRYAERSRVSRLLKKDPVTMTIDDQNILRKWIARYAEKRDQLSQEVCRLTDVLVQAIKAQEYLQAKSEEERRQYISPKAWQTDPHLSYIYDMGGLF